MDYLKRWITHRLTDWLKSRCASVSIKGFGGTFVHYSCCQMYLKGCSHGPWWPHCGGRSRGLSYCALNHLTIKTHSYTEGRTCDPWVLDDAGLLGWQGQDWWSDWARPMVPYWVDPWHKCCLSCIFSTCWKPICTLFAFRDTAVIDKHGYGQIVGRMKDMIIRGGENIYPR